MLNKILMIPLFVLMHFLSANAQIQDQSGNCTCTDLLQETIDKIEVDYIGYHIATKKYYKVAYTHHKNNFLKRAEYLNIESCLPLLQEFIKFFRDGHLFIGMRPKLSEDKKIAMQEKAERFSLSEEELLHYFSKNATILDPIEGIWHDQSGFKYGILKDDSNSDRDFIAIVLESKLENWKEGDIKAEFIKNLDDSYDVVFYNQDHYPIPINIYEENKKGGAHLRRNCMLHMPPHTWGKKLPLVINSSNLIDPTDPRAPVFQEVNEKTVLISIPSHVPSYAKNLEKIVADHQKKIVASQTLIIDIRANEGGSSWITNVLLPYIEGEKTKKPKYYNGDQTYVLSSPDNIKYFERAEQQGWLPSGLMARLQNNPGAVIPFEEESDTASKEEVLTTESNMEKKMPGQIAILIGEGAVSAAEAFVLKVMNYEKVTLFGQATSGVIDYQSVSMSRLNTCSDQQYYLGRPMFAASNRLPKGGVNKTGIIPEVFIPKNIEDKIEFIINYYKQ